MYPKLYPKHCPNCPSTTYLPQFWSSYPIETTYDQREGQFLQTFALPLGDRATESGRNYLTSSGTCNSFLPANCFFCSEDPAEVTLSVAPAFFRGCQIAAHDA